MALLNKHSQYWTVEYVNGSFLLVECETQKQAIRAAEKAWPTCGIMNVYKGEIDGDHEVGVIFPVDPRGYN